jgi:hypothetical protein
MKHFMYGVICNSCGTVELVYDEYIRQLNKPNIGWTCPRCKDSADWDDDSLCMEEEGDPDGDSYKEHELEQDEDERLDDPRHGQAADINKVIK